MNILSEEKLSLGFSSDEFKEEYKEYIKQAKCATFIKFLNGIQLNTKYFRLTTNNKIGRNKHFKNRNISKDTLSIKEINSYLNKLTDTNGDQIVQEIMKRLENKEYLKEMIMDNILEKCIVHPSYNSHYIDILLFIYQNDTNLSEEINEKTDKIYEKLTQLSIDTEQSEYLQFCDKNKKLDSLIGYSLLITELEKKKIIHNKVNSSLTHLLSIMNTNSDADERHKCAQCLYNIFKSYYEDSLLPQGFIDQLNTIKEQEKSMKIKFKIMDIIERK